MSSFRRVALVQSHQRLAPFHAYYLNDLVELCGLAAFVRDDADCVDLPVSPSDREPLATFERYVRRNRPDLVGISAFTCGANSGREYARIAKAMGAFVVAGGFHPSARPEEVLGWPGIDAVVRGEGEHALRDLIRSGSPEGIPGFSYRDNGGFVHHPVPPPIEDLDVLPLPARELRPERFGLAGLDYHTDTIYGSRGCRGRCRFCANDLIGRNWRARANESIMRELATITPPRKGPWKYVKFWDSNFLADARRIEELCHMILDEGLQRWFRFIVETRVEDIIRAEPILATMRRAGFVRVGCGVESPNKATHRGLGKGINLDHVGRAATLIADADMQFTKFLIVGHPDESREDILAYPDFALSHGTRLQKTTIFVMTPYPGTALAEEYVEKDAVSSFDWDLYTNFGAVVEPGDISSLELQGLLFAVCAGVAMSVKFHEGKPFHRVAVGLFEPLFVAVRMARLDDRFSRRGVENTLMDMLGRLPATTNCTRSRSTREKPGSRIAIRFHAPDRSPVVLGIVDEGGEEKLTARVGAERLWRDGRPLRELHMSLPLVVDLVERIDHRRIAHDAATLRWRPSAFELRWLPSFAREAGIVAVALLRFLAFHLRAKVQRA
jgi:radical SAM superfamily enzyme YgiQ (UPF0313 family)